MQNSKKEILTKFKQLFHFHPTKHIEQKSGEWVHKDFYLHDDKLYNHLMSYEDHDIGFFNSYSTNFIAFDIDSHDNKYDVRIVLEALRTYLKIPNFSVLKLSPRGLHAYINFSSIHSVEIIVNQFKKILEKFQYIDYIEIKPTSSIGLRLPTYETFIDQYTFKPLCETQSMMEILNGIDQFQLGEFLSFKVDTLDKCNVIRHTSIDYRFTNGESNNYLNDVVPKLISLGKTNSEIVEYLKSHAEENYRGNIFKNINSLKKRIECYRKERIFLSALGIETLDKMLEEQYILHKEEIENLCKQYPIYSTSLYHREKSLKSLRRSISGIYLAVMLNNKIIDNPELLEYYSSMYPFYRFETNRFCIPLSNNYLRLLSSNFQKHLKFLKHMGILSLPYGRHYDIKKSSCIHYKVKLPTKYIDYNQDVDFNSEIELDNNNLYIDLYSKLNNNKVSSNIDLIQLNTKSLIESILNLRTVIYIINCVYQPMTTMNPLLCNTS